MEDEKDLVMHQKDFIFGTRAVMEAIKSGRPLERVLIKKGLDNELFRELFHHIREAGISYQYVPIEKINRITKKNHQGILAFLSMIDYSNIEMLLPELFENGKDPLLLVLDQVTDVRNFGAIVRTAECGGVHALIIPEKGMPRIGADAVKTSAGALHFTPVCRVNSLTSAVRFLKDSGVKIIAATEKAPKLYINTDMKVPLAIVMGSEEHGISPAILKMADEQVRIPLLGKIESLNVSVTAAVMIYEAWRQRNQM
jgi:23S rRNA (guanosine2251-2'-O)-methyltransferase